MNIQEKNIQKKMIAVKSLKTFNTRNFEIQYSGLVNLESTWSGEFHEFNGFDRVASCASENESEKTKSEKSSDFLDRILENTLTFSTTACCGEGLARHVFHLERMECCKDGFSRPVGSC